MKAEKENKEELYSISRSSVRGMQRKKKRKGRGHHLQGQRESNVLKRDKIPKALQLTGCKDEK